MTWNYRVVEHDIHKESTFEIHEVYYDDKGNIEGYTERSMSPFGTDIKELVNDIAYMTAALSKPILKYSELDELFPDGGIREYPYPEEINLKVGSELPKSE